MLDKSFPIDSEETRKKKSRMFSILDGTFYSSMVGFGESFFSAFAIFLKATSLQLGLLGSLPMFLGSLSQLASERLINLFGSRKRFVTTVAFMQALMHIPIALTFLFNELKVWMLIVAVCLYWIFGSIGSAAWSSWMGELVEENERGAYFGRRNKIAGLMSFITYLLAGYLLQKFGGGGNEVIIGFFIIFCLALLSRIISFTYLLKQYEPYYVEPKEHRMSFVQFISQMKDTNFGIFVTYMSFLNFATYIAAPFFSAYMLQDLHMDYVTFTIINGTSIIVKYLCMPIWGKMSDRFGSRKILSLTAFLVPLVPLVWLFGHSVWYLMLCQVISGFVWAGLELCSFNFLFDTTKPTERASFVSYYNVLNGVALFSGAIIGAVIVKYNNVFWSTFLLVFLISAILRLAAAIIFIPKLKEVRHVESIRYDNLFFKVISTLPSQGLIHDIVTFKVEEEPSKDKNDKKNKNYKIKIQFLEST